MLDDGLVDHRNEQNEVVAVKLPQARPVKIQVGSNTPGSFRADHVFILFELKTSEGKEISFCMNSLDSYVFSEQIRGLLSAVAKMAEGGDATA